MANDKRFVVKNGLQSQNVRFLSKKNAREINASMSNEGSLTFSGANTGRLLDLRDNTSGLVFGANRVGSSYSIEIDDDGTVRIARELGTVLIGTSIDNGVDQLQVGGSISANRFTGDLNGSLYGPDSALVVDAETSTHYGTFVGEFQLGAGGLLEGDLKGSLFGTDSTLLVDGDTGTHYGTFIGKFELEDAGLIEADIKGSVFGADSTLLVDAISGKITLDNNTTDDLSEGTENLYYTSARVKKDSRIMALIFGS